jgi:hypothetical protein
MWSVNSGSDPDAQIMMYNFLDYFTSRDSFMLRLFNPNVRSTRPIFALRKPSGQEMPLIRDVSGGPSVTTG